jgi:hypothetical protein
MASSQEIYSQITQAINPDNSSKRPTLGWVAGAFKRAYDFGRIQAVLNNRSDELDPDTRQTYQNLLKLRDIAVNNGLMVAEGNKYKVTNAGSKFVQDLAKNIKQWESINDLTFKQLRGEVQSAKGQADQEWYNSLSPIEQHIIDLYSKLTIKEFHFLTGVKNDKDGKNRYVNRIETMEDSDPESYNMLRDLGFITKKNTINDALVSTFFRTLGKYDYRHLRSFNRSISSRSDRLAADAALNQNHADRMATDRNPTDGGMMSDRERMVANSRMPSDVEEPNNRQQQRSRILGGRKDAFNDRMRRTRPANESKSLSFKQFLIEKIDK